MIKLPVVKNGKKYIVNAPGWNYDVGPGAPPGDLFMFSATDGRWYQVNLTGHPAASFSVNPTPLTLSTNDLGYELVKSSNGNTYQVYLSGSGGAAVVLVNTTPWSNPLDYKPSLFLRSVTDNFGYNVYLVGTTLTIDATHSSSIVNS